MSLKFSIEETPPGHSLPFLSLQHILTMVGATIAVPSILAGAFGLNSVQSALLISNVLIAMGIATLIQTKLGTRLPIIQGSSFAFLPALLYVSTLYPGSEGLAYASGAIIVGALLQAILGFSGAAGTLQKILTPVVVGPTIMVIGLSLFSEGGRQAATDWPIAITTIFLIIVFSFGIFAITREKLGWISTFPVVLAIALVWAYCAIASLAGWLDAGAAGFIDFQAIGDAPILKTSGYILPWGTPKFDFAFLLVFIVAYLVSTVESIGDYNALNEIAHDTPTNLDPKTVNRGVMAEGFGSFIAGLMGTNPTTSYSENIGVVGITEVASRSVVVLAAVFLIVAGLIPAIGTVLASIPTPIMGGLYCVLFGMIAGIGLRYAAKADLRSMRNISVMGFALFFGFAVPTAFASEEARQLILEMFGQGPADVVLGIVTSNMAITALSAIIADNIVPKD